METDFLHIYNELKEVPQKYLKTIQAGRLKGMSDIKPQWRIQRLTEVLGPCGIGWKIQNLKFEYKEVKDEIVCNCYLEFLFKYNGEWSDPIPAIGGNKLATMERNGLYISDESQKMAYTDAISVATKMIGLASDVYMGHGGKYDNENNTPQPHPTNNSNDLPWLTDKEFKGLMEKGTLEQYENAKLQRRIKKDFKTQLDQKFNQK